MMGDLQLPSFMRAKHCAERLIIFLLKYEVIWIPLRFLVKIARFTERMRCIALFQQGQSLAPGGGDLPGQFANPVVLHGPFAGMAYPSYSACGSLLLPKLLGSYEREIQDAVEEFAVKEYELIWDIGCAEGYYAVGFARRVPTARIIAFDTDKRARHLCREMAEANQVAGKVELREACAPDSLRQLENVRALVICDCEGYELELFTEHTIPGLKMCDLVIETHDLYGVEIADRLAKLFSQTHLVERISSVDDIVKAATYRFPETSSFSFKDRIKAFAEGRQNQMEWIICRAGFCA